METVYIVLTTSVAVVAVITVVILRNRITKGRVDVSLSERKASVEIKATQPNRVASEDTPTRHVARRTPRSGFVGNIARWWSSIRAPEGARVVNNVAAMGSSIEVIPRTPATNDEPQEDKSKSKSKV